MRKIDIYALVMLFSLLTSFLMAGSSTVIYSNLSNRLGSLSSRTITVPDDYPTIQAAINAASDGDTVYVHNGTYGENLIVDKSLLLIGESRDSTIVIGNVLVQTSHVQFKGFSIEGDMPGSGITLSYSNDSVISGNKITSKRWAGIILRDYSSNNTLSSNIIVDNEYGINIEIGGGPDGSCNNVMVNNIVSNNTVGIEIHTASTGNRIICNKIENNSDGGIEILNAGASNNKIFHNNILYNGEPFDGNAVDLSSNIWDNAHPSGGNYWSDYAGVDSFSGPHQNETGSDGMGDTPYVIDASDQDNYPLTHPYGSIQNLNTSLVYLSIQSAIDAPETLDGHTIFVRNGTYYENVVVNKQVRLLGENRIGTIIDANATGIVLNIVANNVSVSSFTIEGGGSTSPDSGVLLQSVANCSVFGNRIIENLGDGIFLMGCSNNVIFGNEVVGNDVDGISVSGSTFNTVSGNNVTGSGWSGIGLFGYSSENNVTSNIVANNPEGIAVVISARNEISENTIVNNSNWGISIYQSLNNSIFHNNFNNSLQVNSDGSPNMWDNGCEGNYWSDYNGTDSNGDGIGDIPYTIDANNTDRYPLMNVYWSLCDVNHDLKIDIRDISLAAKAFATVLGMFLWDPHADITGPERFVPDGKVDMRDIALIAKHFGEYAP